MSDDDIVISGFSARFPQADSLTEFGEKLYRGYDFITDDDARWPHGFLGLPDRFGKMRDLSKFDALFFGVNPKQVQMMDPQLRLLLETSYEAIFDAGYDPAALRGRNIGVFVGCCVSETASARSIAGAEEADGYSLLGCNLAMFSNRISYCFDFHGPSETVDTACASTMTALDNAARAIRAGLCEAAIVGGCNVILNPVTSLKLWRMNMLSKEGKCKVLDADANGYVRSETVGAIFLQMGSQARRVYANLIHVRGNTDGYKSEGITYPSGKEREKLFRDAYAEAKVDPRDVCYVEVHGTGTKVGDPEEVDAISRFFCQTPRETPLMVGSVKSNVGHAEAASGICSIAKLILALDTGTIAGNLHFTEPNPNIPSLLDGTIEVVDYNKPLTGSMVGIDSSGFGGANVHAILQVQSGPHVNYLPPIKPELPRLVILAGRSADTLAATIEKLEMEGPHPDSMYALLNKVGQPNVKLFPFRGFTVIPTSAESKATLRGNPEEAPLKKKPLWFVFTGIGCQWNGMARQMMQFDLFARSIHKSHKVLKQFNLDLIELVTSEDLDTQSPASTFASITAIQVALVDVLSAVGVRPDGFLGHSLGEIGCAYADGALSAEQAVLCAYWRGHCVEQGNVAKGAMAVVGLTWEEAESRCSNEVFPACHNAEDSVTVSGPTDSVARFLEELKAENVFVSGVNSLNVAFHCPHIHSVGPALLEALKKVIPEPKCRSSKWISTSVGEGACKEPIAQRCSADYFVNNFLSPVLFYEALQHVPKDAIVIEIAPHSLLQVIMRGVLGPNAACLGLMKRDCDTTVLLRSLGQLHVLGVQLDLSPLYPPVEWPVPRGTPSLAHYVSWDHSQSWKVAGWKEFVNTDEASEEVVEVDLAGNEGDVYLAERTINGQVVFPASTHMVLAWKSLASHCAKPIDQVPVIFEDVTIHRDILLPKSGTARFQVNVMRESGQFQVRKDDAVAASGHIRIAEEEWKLPSVGRAFDNEGAIEYELDAEDIYKELRLRGSDHNGAFRCILNSDIQVERGKLKWEHNWVTFLDSMLQFVSLTNHLRTSTLPTKIEFCCVDPQAQAGVAANAGDAGLHVVYERYLNTCTAGGVVMRNVTYRPTPRWTDPQEPLLEEYRFVPYVDNNADELQRQACVKPYVELCSDVAQCILSRCYPNGTHPLNRLTEFCDPSDKPLDHIPDRLAENHGLLRTLIVILSSPSDSPSSLATCIQSARSHHKKDLEADLLNTALFGEDPLRHILDIVTENTFANKLRILELGFEKDSLLLAPWVLSALSLFNTGRKTEYAIAHTFPDCLVREELSEGMRIVNAGAVFSTEGELAKADLVVGRMHTGDFTEFSSLAKKLSAYCKTNAFVLIAMRTELTPAELFLKTVIETPVQTFTCESVKAEFEKNGFRLVALKSNIWSALLLFRNCNSSAESGNQEMVTVKRSDLDWVETLKETARKCKSGPGGQNLWLLPEDTGISGIIGLTKCLCAESVGSHIRCVLDESHCEPNKVCNFSPSNPEYIDVLERDLVMNVYCDGQWGSYRHSAMESRDLLKKTTQFAHAKMTPGDPSSVQWYESAIPHKATSTVQSNKRVLCSVYYSPLNPRDVMIGSPRSLEYALPGTLASQDSSLGVEFSGRDPKGRRVMGLVSSEAMATVVEADVDFLWEVPAAWSLREASTVPAAYSTAYYALLVRGIMRPRESILVHGGSCDVGQAAISIAFSMGCTLFTTVGSFDEYRFLKYRFPELKDFQIINSKETSFERHVLLQTKGHGVNLVLNCSTKESFQAALRCVSPQGRFLDINPCDDTSEDVCLGKSASLKNISYHSISINSLFGNDSSVAAARSRVSQHVLHGIASGAIRPLNTALFVRDQAADAFQFMASGNHVKKVVLQIRPEESERKAVPASPLSVEALARTWFYESKSYIIIGGLGGFGLELTNWMVSRGCRKLVLCSRSGVRTGYQRLCLHRWERAGAKVLVSTADTSTEEGAEGVIEKAKALGTVGGVFNLAAVLRDALLENQTVGAYKAVCQPKVDVTERLDELTRRLCPELDHFVVFSSAVCGRGNRGQTNYGYANSFMEQLCRRRVADGLPGLAIQWGAIDDVGVFYETMGPAASVCRTRPQRITSCLDVLDRFLSLKVPVVSSLIKTGQTLVSNTHSRQDLVKLISEIIGMKDTSSFKPFITLGEYGLDSIIGVEVQDVIERHCGLLLSMQEIQQLTVEMLQEMSRMTTSECKEPPPETH